MAGAPEKIHSQNSAIASRTTRVAALKISLPWAPAEHEQTVAAMGEDFWSYGVGPNEKVLDTFLRYHHEQGLSKRRVTVDEMFAAGTREKFVI